MRESQLLVLGGPQGGTVSALAVVQSNATLYVGSTVGLWCASLAGNGNLDAWQRLPNAPLGILAVAVSPCFADDRLISVGTDVGIYLSSDAGASWVLAQMPVSSATILTIAFSPNFAADGVVFAGTLEDGIWCSRDRGRTWEPRNFGLLDSAVFCLAFSPNFAGDGTIYIGTEGALYQSYNGGRAWKELSFVDDIAPIVGIALSPDFSKDGVLFVGTEQQGLFRSMDRGSTWAASELPAHGISAIAMAASAECLAATDAGMFRSTDAGQTWQCINEMTHALCLHAHRHTVFAGLMHDGLAFSNDGTHWSIVDTPPMRSVVGLALSPHFGQDGVGFCYGPQEGIWRSLDGGQTWYDAGEALPSEDIHTLLVAADPRKRTPVLIAAASNAVFSSADKSDHWQTIWQQSVVALACSPEGNDLLLADASANLYCSKDRGLHWQTLPVAWPDQNRILAVAIQGAAMHVAVEDADAIAIWLWVGGQWRQVLRHSFASERTPVVRFWHPTHGASATAFVGIGQQLWQVSGDAHATPYHIELNGDAPNASEEIVALDGPKDRDDVVFVCTHRRVWRWRVGSKPTVVHDFGEDRAVAFALSPDSSDTGLSSWAYAVLLGGRLAQLEGKMNHDDN